MRARSVFGGIGVLFDTPEDDAKAAAAATAAKAQADAIDAAVEKATAPLKASVTALSAELRTLKPVKKDDDPPPAKTPTERVQKLEDKLAARDEKSQKKAIRAELRERAGGLGCTERIADLVDLTLMRNKLVFDDETEAVLVDVGDEKIPLQTWLTERDKAGELNSYKPLAKTPKKGVNNGNGSGGADLPKVTREQLRTGKFDPKVLQGKYEVVDE